MDAIRGRRRMVTDKKSKRMTIFSDLGIRAGSGVIKAITLGADAILVGSA